MKKINLFNKTISPLSDGKGCPVERGGVWELPRRTPCATPSWKEGEHKVPSFRGNAESPRCCRELVCGKTDGIPLFSGMTVRICGMMIAIAALFATPSFAEPTELDKKTVASKAYVDTKQDKIPAGTYGANNSVVTYDSTTGDVQERWIAGVGNLGENTSSHPVAFKNSLASYDGNTGHLTSITSNFKKVVANGVLRDLTIEEFEGSLVPVRMLAGALYYKQDKLPSTAGMSPTGGLTIDLDSIAGQVNRRYITAGGSRPLKDITGADNVILYINGTKTLAEYQTSNFGATGNAATTNENYINGALVSLELLKDVYSALHNEIQNATPTGTPGNVAMYDPTTGALGDGVATYDGSTTYNASTDADKIAVMSGVQRKKECGGYEPGHENDPDYCWLWILPD